MIAKPLLAQWKGSRPSGAELTLLGLLRKIWATARNTPYAIGMMKHRITFNWNMEESGSCWHVSGSRGWRERTQGCFDITIQFFQNSAQNCRRNSPVIFLMLPVKGSSKP